MKSRHTKATAKRRELAADKAKDTSSKVDALEIQRGQNAEKGNTFNPRNLRDAKEAAH